MLKSALYGSATALMLAVSEVVGGRRRRDEVVQMGDPLWCWLYTRAVKCLGLSDGSYVLDQSSSKEVWCLIRCGRGKEDEARRLEVWSTGGKGVAGLIYLGWVLRAWMLLGMGGSSEV